MSSRSALIALLVLLGGCTAQPLYTQTGLPAIEVSPPTSRVEQQIRNHLLFYASGGGAPSYRLNLQTTVRDARATSVNTRRVNLEPTSGIVTVTTAYVLTDALTGEQVGAGSRSAQAPYDIPVQEFAAQRSKRDAEDRAARELAEMLRLAIPTATRSRRLSDQ